jgi:hypothetical protein
MTQILSRVIFPANCTSVLLYPPKGVVLRAQQQHPLKREPNCGKGLHTPVSL